MLGLGTVLLRPPLQEPRRLRRQLQPVRRADHRRTATPTTGSSPPPRRKGSTPRPPSASTTPGRRWRRSPGSRSTAGSRSTSPARCDGPKTSTQMKIMSLATFVHIAIAMILASRLLLEVRPRLLRRDQRPQRHESYPFAGAPPYYTFLTSIAGRQHRCFAWWLLITFAVAYPLLMLPNIAIAVRTFFAWALDGMLPSQFARVSPRTHAPNYAIGLTVVLSIARPLLGGKQRRRVHQSPLRGGAAAAGDDDPARRSQRCCCPIAGPTSGGRRRPPSGSSGFPSSRWPGR